VGNSASGNGGAILAASIVTIQQSTFLTNSAPAGSGGGVAANGSLIVSGSELTANTAQNRGGAILVTGTLGSSGSTFFANGSIQGGAVAVFGAADVRGSTFQQNSVTLIMPGPIGAPFNAEGGAFLISGTATISANQFLTNSSSSPTFGFLSDPSAGGAVKATSSVTVQNNTFSGNAAGSGGAIDVSGGSNKIDQNVFSANGSSSGGAVRTVLPVDITRNRFFDNGGTASIFFNPFGVVGGAVFLVNGGSGFDRALVLDNLFVRNRAGGSLIIPGSTDEAQVHNEGQLTTLINNTFVASSGITIEAVRSLTGTISVANSIITGGSGLRQISGTMFSTANLYFNMITNTTGTISETFAVTADPRFTNAAADDYSLQSTSPAIDAADDQFIAGTLLDLAGNPRIVDDPGVANLTIDGIEQIADRGALEFQPPPPNPPENPPDNPPGNPPGGSPTPPSGGGPPIVYVPIAASGYNGGW
jgi:predicted outer membrane repeat protein